MSLKHINSENEISPTLNFKSSNNLYALISPSQKKTSKTKDFSIKLKTKENLSCFQKILKVTSEEKKSELSKLNALEDSTLKSSELKNDEIEENKNEFIEKAQKKVFPKIKPPLGAFKSPKNKNNLQPAYRGSFGDFNKSKNMDNYFKQDSKEIESWDTLNCSLEEIRRFDDGICRSQEFSKKGITKKFMLSL